MGQQIRNGGEWTEARYNGFIKSALRAASQKWPPRNQCIKDARVRRGWYKCDGCGNEVPATLPPKPGNKKRIKNIVADHVDPVVPTKEGFTTWDEVIERMFVERGGFQALCHDCHTNIKSKAESEERKKYKNYRKEFPREESSWRNMKSRCLNKKATGYEHYGGRGISVCDRWLDDFINFYNDMGPRPEGHSLEREDVDGDYCPGNCKWATSKEQAYNRRNNHLVSYDGDCKTVAQWAEELGCLQNTLLYRMRRGWSTGEALGFEARKAPQLSRYSDDEWLEITLLREQGHTTTELGDMFDIDPSQVCRKTNKIIKARKANEKL